MAVYAAIIATWSAIVAYRSSTISGPIVEVRLEHSKDERLVLEVVNRGRAPIQVLDVILELDPTKPHPLPPHPDNSDWLIEVKVRDVMEETDHSFPARLEGSSTLGWIVTDRLVALAFEMVLVGAAIRDSERRIMGVMEKQARKLGPLNVRAFAVLGDGTIRRCSSAEKLRWRWQELDG